MYLIVHLTIFFNIYLYSYSEESTEKNIKQKTNNKR